jgi:hypothetical protein
MKRPTMSNIPSNLSREEVWSALVQTAHALLMYNSHKRYVEETLLKEKPEISPPELAIRLNIPLGEALVLLSETRNDHGTPWGVGEAAHKSDDRSLLDYTG